MKVFVDDKYLFRDIVVGWLGSVYDVRLFLNFELYIFGCSS